MFEILFPNPPTFGKFVCLRGTFLVGFRLP